MKSSKRIKDNELNKVISPIQGIKSQHILKEIFNDVPKNILLKIIKYNKKIQKRINIEFKDYKDYSEIEIEITPVQHMEGNFINSPHKNMRNYYHIFSNDFEVELERFCLKKTDRFQNIKIIIDYQVESLSNLFKDCKTIESITFKRFNRKNINDMNCMFWGCSSLKKANLLNFKTDKVINMRGMFRGCLSLKELNLSNFVTNNVNNMSCMFEGCSSLTKLLIPKFDTINVSDMNYMFYGCLSLEELDLSSFNILGVNNLKGMFSGCNLLTRVIIPNFKIKKNAEIKDIVYNCPEIFKMQIREQNMEINKEVFK